MGRTWRRNGAEFKVDREPWKNRSKKSDKRRQKIRNDDPKSIPKTEDLKSEIDEEGYGLK